MPDIKALQLRQPGRTTRHLERAIDLARAGAGVVYFVSNDHEVKRITALARQLAGQAAWVLDGGNLRVLPVNSQAVKEDSPGDYHWLGFKPDVYLVDHHVLEERYPDVLNNWLRAVE